MPRDPEKTSIVDDDSTSVNKIGIRVPPFWPEDAELWFAQLEGTFISCDITDDATRYAYVLSRIEPKQAREIKDIITQPLLKQKYEAIKKALIQRLTASQDQRIKQLLEHEELGDRKPSQFLRHLKTLAGITVSDELLRTLWLGRLPTQMQAILAVRAQDKLEDVAEQADRIHEIGNRPMEVATMQGVVTPARTTWETQIDALRDQVAALTTQVTKMTRKFQREQQGKRPRSQSRDRQRSRTPRREGICYYHRRFGAEAKKCTTPCSFKKENEEASR
ncbi:uncharacterized protein [Polyergus mexicanus]|uniref:uncharacterized protein n=1 Tax=Polyergus mexicanus TaxID=615972 RepID=UPI0038B685CC